MWQILKTNSVLKAIRILSTCYSKLVASELYKWNVFNHLPPVSYIVWVEETLTSIQLSTLRQFETEEKSKTQNFLFFPINIEVTDFPFLVKIWILSAY